MSMHLSRRRALGCCGAALGTGLFTSLQAQAKCSDPLPAGLIRHERVQRALAGLDAAALWDVHAHLLGTGDSGSGCSIHEHMTQWWHPMETVRRRVILGAACVDGDAPSVDRAHTQRLVQLAADFPPARAGCCTPLTLRSMIVAASAPTGPPSMCPMPMPQRSQPASRSASSGWPPFTPIGRMR